MKKSIKPTQCERILRRLRDCGSITAAIAIGEYGIYRLASRITDLKKQGYRFDVKFGRGKNRYGESTHYAIYRLIEDTEVHNNGIQ